MFVGTPTDDQRHYFQLASEAQRLAMDALAPGVEVSYVDDVVHEYFAEHGVTDLARHHLSHNIGLGAHEPPYLDRGNDATVESGHVYTIEPGLYTDTAGYRHSDTIAVTDDGTEQLTYYPRDIQSNTLE
jgi:Xaa-Pro aminopeptidase